MNDLQICNENGELINMQIDSCNAAADFFDAISKKGARDFLSDMRTMTFKERMKEMRVREQEIQSRVDITKIQEDSKYRLAKIDATSKLDLAKVKAISEYKNKELDSNTQIGLSEEETKRVQISEASKNNLAQIKANSQLDLSEEETKRVQISEASKNNLAQIKANSQLDLSKEETKREQIASEAEIRRSELKNFTKFKETEISSAEKIRLAEIETVQLKITEQSKCLQKILDVVQGSYDRKFDFYETQLKSCMDFFLPQINLMNEELKILTQQRNMSYNNQDIFMIVQKQITSLTRCRNEINDRYMKIQSDLTFAASMAKLELKESFNALLN